MYPELFRIGSHAVATYGLVVALAVLAGGALLARGFEERGLEPDDAWSVIWWALVGAVVGAKTYYVLLHGDPGAFLSRSGLVWYGGLIGGLAAGWIGTRRMGLPLGRVADAAAPALALGHGLGHIGCFFSGDSYGLPSGLPWAVAFPRGAPPSTAGNLRHVFGVRIPAGIPDGQLLTVHPTMLSMLYSAAFLLAAAVLLWALRRRPWRPGRLFALYLVLAGTERFAVELLRAKDDRLLWGLTTAQGVALVSLAAGLALFVALRQRAAREGRGAAAAPTIAGEWRP